MLNLWDMIFHLFRVHKDNLLSSGPIFAQPLICSRFVKYLSLLSICICPPQHYYFPLYLWPGACLTDRQLSKACQPPFGDFQLCFYGLIAVIFIVCLLAFSRKYSEEWHSPHLSTWPPPPESGWSIGDQWKTPHLPITIPRPTIRKITIPKPSTIDNRGPNNTGRKLVPWCQAVAENRAHGLRNGGG